MMCFVKNFFLEIKKKFYSISTKKKKEQNRRKITFNFFVLKPNFSSRKKLKTFRRCIVYAEYSFFFSQSFPSTITITFVKQWIVNNFFPEQFHKNGGILWRRKTKWKTKQWGKSKDLWKFSVWKQEEKLWNEPQTGEKNFFFFLSCREFLLLMNFWFCQFCFPNFPWILGKFTSI